jgi:thiamine-monophosphate kinase
MKNISEPLTEHKLISQIAKLCPNRSKDLLLSIGDDAAVFTPQYLGGKNMVACQDLLIENVHFKLSTHSAEDLGYKSIAVNFSDIAAMGATPLFVMISIAIPKHLTESHWIESFYKGANILCEKYGASIMGGDLSSSPTQLFIDVSVIGVCIDKPILRSGAKPGDLIAITGQLGLSHTGFRVLSANNSSINTREFHTAISRHLRPQPRLEAAQKLAPYINSLIDISDGLVNDLNIVLNQSSSAINCKKDSNKKGSTTHMQLGAELNFTQTPFLHPETINYCQKQNDSIKQTANAHNEKTISQFFRPIDFALYGGEDFELLFSFTQEKLAEVEKTLHDTDWCVIGKVTDSGQITYLQNGQTYNIDLAKRWSHF